MATTLQAAERGRQGRIMVGKSARKPRRRPSLELEQGSVETDDEEREAKLQAWMDATNATENGTDAPQKNARKQAHQAAAQKSWAAQFWSR